ncbi:uncharacterized protein VTP21DRAFT_408 [Calcarisporiella thermophila]|uniref:uncharacterized protein n=1 Tax=Calcarisporiella thermophila TaxID=911321 RepID=UPI0037446E5F
MGQAIALPCPYCHDSFVVPETVHEHIVKHHPTFPDVPLSIICSAGYTTLAKSGYFLQVPPQEPPKAPLPPPGPPPPLYCFNFYSPGGLPMPLPLPTQPPSAPPKTDAKPAEEKKKPYWGFPK